MTGLLAAIEAGGTTFRCVVARDDAAAGNWIADKTVQTTSPDQTLAEVFTFLQTYPVRALGIASFGPLDLNPGSATFGSILDTPKPGWQNVNLLQRCRDVLNVPVAIATDVHAAGLAELQERAECRSLVYITVGTGIGGALVERDRPAPIHHAEMGHIFVPRHDDDQAASFAGVCPFHGDCVEGLASAPAIEARWGQPADQCGEAHPAWPMQAHYLGLLCTSITRIGVPDCIVLGGGVMQAPGLLERVRTEHTTRLGKYHVASTRRVDEYIQAPLLGQEAGVQGALLLAAAAG